MDQGNNRITVVPASGQPVHLHVPGVGHDVLATGRGYVVQGTIPSPDRSGYLLHRFGPDQQLAESFARVVEPTSRYMTYAPRAAAARSNGNILVAERGRYRISEVDARDNVTRVYSRNAPWFEPWDEPRSGEPLSAPPRPTLADIAVDDEGLVWVLHYVASSQWRPVSRDVRDEWVPDDVYDSIIEVLDLDNRAVVASIRMPHLVSRFLAPGSGYALRQVVTPIRVMPDVPQLQPCIVHVCTMCTDRSPASRMHTRRSHGAHLNSRLSTWSVGRAIRPLIHVVGVPRTPVR
jgi:hypothetical protein